MYEILLGFFDAQNNTSLPQFWISWEDEKNKYGRKSNHFSFLSNKAKVENIALIFLTK